MTKGAGRFFRGFAVRAPLVVGLLAACDGDAGPTSSLGERCGPYPSQQSSPYLLPYPAGMSWTVLQGNCTPGTHFAGGRDQHAYDFAMPVGSPVVAARAGLVVEVEERYPDGNGAVDQSNYVAVQHDDGTLAVYFHLTQNGVLVELGRSVRQGEEIAASGVTGGTSTPHLHFGVIGGTGRTIAVTFRNTEPHPDGLQQGQTYPAF